MAVAGGAGHRETIAGVEYRLVLRNAEIERFEVQYAPFGIFTLFDQLFGRGDAPQARHVRDIIALGLIGGGMGDKAADALVESWGPEQNMVLRFAAQRLLGVTFMPAVLAAPAKKAPAGSDRKRATPVQPATTSPHASATSAA